MSIENIASEKNDWFFVVCDDFRENRLKATNCQFHTIRLQKENLSAESADLHFVEGNQAQFNNQPARDHRTIGSAIQLGGHVGGLTSRFRTPNGHMNEWRRRLHLLVVTVANHAPSTGRDR